MFIEVCKDLDGRSPWFYDDVQQKYLRCSPDGLPDVMGKLTAHLHGRDIPNPDVLYQARMRQLEIAEAHGVKVTERQRIEAKPSSVTYALWAHWQEVSHAHSDA